METLDVIPTASILTIGAVKFDPFGDDVNEPSCEKFYVKVDLDSCDRLGCTVSQSTLDWWAGQEQAAQDEAFSPDGRIPIESAMDQLYKFCWGAKRVWSHGARAWRTAVLLRRHDRRRPCRRPRHGPRDAIRPADGRADPRPARD